MSKEILAVGEYVVIKPITEEASPGGIVYSDCSEGENPKKGVIVGIVEEDEFCEENIVKGDVVYYDFTYGGFNVKGFHVVHVDRIIAAEGEDEEDEEIQEGVLELTIPAGRFAIFHDIQEYIDVNQQVGGMGYQDDEKDWENHIRSYANGEGHAKNISFKDRMKIVAALAISAIEQGSIEEDTELEASEAA